MLLMLFKKYWMLYLYVHLYWLETGQKPNDNVRMYVYIDMYYYITLVLLYNTCWFVRVKYICILYVNK